MVHGPASTSGRFALRLNLVHIDKHHFEQVGAMQAGSQVIVLIVPMLWTFPPMREICRDCKVRADASIASLVGLRQILKHLLEHGHVGIDCYCSPFYFQLGQDGSSDTVLNRVLQFKDIKSGTSTSVIEGQLGLDVATLAVACRHFNYKSGDHCVIPLVRLSSFFLSALELIDPLGGESRYPRFGRCFRRTIDKYNSWENTFVPMSTDEGVDLYLLESWFDVRSNINSLRDESGATHAWMDQQRTNFMLLRSSMRGLLLHGYSFATTNLVWQRMDRSGGCSPTLTPLMYEEVEVKK
jgi:hypothetical protein